MTKRSPIPACLSHLTQRDAAVRARALEEAAHIADQLSLPHRNYGDGQRWTAYVQSRRDAVAAIRRLIPTPPAPAPDEARGPHNACGAGSCDQPNRCASEGECHYTKSPFYQPSRAAPDEAASRVTRSAIDGASAPDRTHQVTAHETGGVADHVPGTDEDGSETWYREDYVKKIEAERDAMLAIRAELVAALRLIADFPIAEQDDFHSANMRKIARAALAKNEGIP